MTTKTRDTFHADNQSSWDIHNRFCVHFFKQCSLRGEFASIKYAPTNKKPTASDELIIELQKKGVDVATIDKQTGNTVFWDEKADSHAPKNFCLEWWSNTDFNRKNPGWMQTSKAHWILYCFILSDEAVEAYALDNQELQKWLWEKHLKQDYPLYIMPDTINHTASFIVPVNHVMKSSVTAYRYLITADGSVKRLPS